MNKIKLFCSAVTIMTLLTSSTVIKTNEYNEKDIILKETGTIKQTIIEYDENGSIIVPNDNPIDIIKEPNIKTITISAVGDCTLGSDVKYGLNNSFLEKSKTVNDGYFFSGVKEILSNDDYTIANLECALTENKNAKDKEFAFRGEPSFVNILKEGSVECVNNANNHSKDFYEEGYNETIKVLENNLIDHFGYETISIKEIDGIKIANAGFTSYYAGHVEPYQIKEALEKMDEMGADIKIISIHGGYEGEYEFDPIKQNLAHYAIDNGASLVLGHHPHVLQGIETYKGKNIVYSLGNFCYGGSRYPNDKDSMIYQHTFTFENDILVDEESKIIPVHITGSIGNDFRPVLVNEEENERIINKVLTYSHNFEYKK